MRYMSLRVYWPYSAPGIYPNLIYSTSGIQPKMVGWVLGRDICRSAHGSGFECSRGMYAVRDISELNLSFVRLSLGIAQASKKRAIGRSRHICVSLCVELILDAYRRIYAPLGGIEFLGPCDGARRQPIRIDASNAISPLGCSGVMCVCASARICSSDVQKALPERPARRVRMNVSLRGANALQALVRCHAHDAAKRPRPIWAEVNWN